MPKNVRSLSIKLSMKCGNPKLEPNMRMNSVICNLLRIKLSNNCRKSMKKKQYKTDKPKNNRLFSKRQKVREERKKGQKKFKGPTRKRLWSNSENLRSANTKRKEKVSSIAHKRVIYMRLSNFLNYKSNQTYSVADQEI